MGPDSDADGMHLLERAVAAVVAWRVGGRAESEEDLLARHPELRELMLPMLRADSAPQPADERVLGDFRLVREIGRGGMGVVYEAVQTALGRRVALKVLPSHLGLHGSAIVRFEREATLAAQLRHPGIVPVHAIGRAEGAQWFAMELIEGASLDRVLAEIEGRPFAELNGRTLQSAVARCLGASPAATGAEAQADPWARGYVETVAEIVAQVADALQHAHAAGVIHRDVKPSNILLRFDGRAVLTDFGLARQVGAASLTITGDFAGTPFYVSPEQAMAKRLPVDHRTDLFSLGATLYELLTLQRAFDGDSVPAVLSRIVTKEPADPQRVNPLLPRDLTAIVLKALEKDADRRYPTAAALAGDLRAFVAYRPVQARRASAPVRVRRWVQREPLKATLAGVLLLTVPAIAGLGGYLLKSRQETLVGRDKLRRDQVESLLEAGFAGMYTDDATADVTADFERALAIDPTCVEAVAGLALATAGRRGPAAALALLAQSRSAETEQQKLGRIRAVLLRAAGQAEEALELEKALGEPRTAFDLFFASMYAADEGKRDPRRLRAAYDLATRCLAMAPAARTIYHLHRASVAGRLADAELAKEATAPLEVLWPSSARGWEAIGLAFSLCDHRRAVRAFETSIRLDPGCPRVHQSLAASLAEARDFTAARAACERALEGQKGRVPAAHALRVRILRASGDTAGAEQHCRQSLSLHPDAALLHEELANLLVLRGDGEGAIAAYRRAVDLDPRLADACFNLGVQLRQRGDVEAAIAAYRQALQASPGHLEANNNLAVVLSDQGNLEDALLLFRRAIATDAGYRKGHVNLVIALRRLEQHADLRAELERWTRVRPEEAEAWRDLAWFLVDPSTPAEQHDAKGGLAAAQRAVELSRGNDAAVLAALAEAKFANGDTKAAIEQTLLALALAERAKPVDTSLVQRLRRAGRRYQAALPASDR